MRKCRRACALKTDHLGVVATMNMDMVFRRISLLSPACMIGFNVASNETALRPMLRIIVSPCCGLLLLVVRRLTDVPGQQLMGGNLTRWQEKQIRGKYSKLLRHACLPEVHRDDGKWYRANPVMASIPPLSFGHISRSTNCVQVLGRRSHGLYPW